MYRISPLAVPLASEPAPQVYRGTHFFEVSFDMEVLESVMKRGEEERGRDDENQMDAREKGEDGVYEEKE